MERIHFENFYLAGFTYYDGPVTFNELKIGTALKLVPDPENKYDDDAVMVYFNQHKLGYVPRDNNKHISAILKSGVDLFDARIQMIKPDTHPEKQIMVVVYAKGEQQ